MKELLIGIVIGFCGLCAFMNHTVGSYPEIVAAMEHVDKCIIPQDMSKEG